MNYRRVSLSIILAFLLFTPLFVAGGSGRFDFWWWMVMNGVILTASALYSDPWYIERIKKDFSRSPVSKIAIGLASAAVLFAVFEAGNLLSGLLIERAPSDIEAVYRFRGEASLVRIVMSIAFVIGPAEEIFWRGFIQNFLNERMRVFSAVLLSAVLYSAVHAASGNMMLLAAAFVCGIFWGTLYVWRKSILINVVSHTAWDLAAFVVFPFE